MNDRLNRLEAELAGMQPTELSRDLANRIKIEIEADSARGSRWSDRFLLSAICSGLAAACVIATVLFSGAQPSISSGPSTAMFQSNPAQLGDPSLAVSLADGRWADVLQ